MLKENENRIVTRASAHNFFKPRVANQGTHTFFIQAYVTGTSCLISWKKLIMWMPLKWN